VQCTLSGGHGLRYGFLESSLYESRGVFTFELLLVAVVVAVIVGGVIYLASRNRRNRRETGRRVGTADVPVRAAPEEPLGDATGETAPHQPRREFYKSMDLETPEDNGYTCTSSRSTGTISAGRTPCQTVDSWPC
jgi:hypothetical protein